METLVPTDVGIAKVVLLKIPDVAALVTGKLEAETEPDADIEPVPVSGPAVAAPVEFV